MLTAEEARKKHTDALQTCLDEIGERIEEESVDAYECYYCIGRIEYDVVDEIVRHLVDLGYAVDKDCRFLHISWKPEK